MAVEERLPVHSAGDDCKVGATGKLVCVTGASGFIACHIIRQLLEQGYHVRGTLRNPNDLLKVAPILKLAKDTPGQLELVRAELLEPGSFDDAVKDCTYVVHVASPVILKAKDPQKDVVDPMVKGVDNVMCAIIKAKSAKRVVVTSSVGAVFDHRIKAEHVYTEEDWNEHSSLQIMPYQLGKMLAERAAWKHHEEQLKDGWRFELVTMLPGVVLGPVFSAQHCHSASTKQIHDFLTGSMVMAPDLYLSLVDARDCAIAHVRALQSEHARGRYILVSENRSYLQISQVLQKRFPKGYSFPSWRALYFLLYLIAPFHSQLSWAYLHSRLGVNIPFSNLKAREDLGIQFRPVEESIVDTAMSMIENNFV